MEKYVLTGGPGVGKTTLLNQLKQRGYYTVKEVSEGVIAEQQKKKGNLLPWIDVDRFEREVIKRQKRLEDKITGNTVAFLDRGLADCIAYYRFYNSKVPEIIKKYTQEAGYTKILILEPLRKYKNTKIRTENEEESVRIHGLIEQAYKEAGYEIIKVPALPKKERVEWVRKTLKLK